MHVQKDREFKVAFMTKNDKYLNKIAYSQRLIAELEPKIRKAQQDIKEATRFIISNLLAESGLTQNDMVGDELNQCMAPKKEWMYRTPGSVIWSSIQIKTQFKPHKIIPAMIKGYIPTRIKGHLDIAVTDILINEQGIVEEVYYAKKDISDHFNFEKIKEFALSYIKNLFYSIIVINL